MDLELTQLLDPLDRGVPCGPSARDFDEFLTLGPLVD